MSAAHLKLLVEEPSMEAFLRAFLPQLLPQDRTFEIHPFQGKNDLLAKLEARLRGYAAWLPADWRIVVVVDRDDEDCHELKGQLEAIARRAGLRTRTRALNARWQLVNRIAIEELEAWYFGDWAAVRAVFPRTSANVPRRQGFRNADAIAGGTCDRRACQSRAKLVTEFQSIQCRDHRRDHLSSPSLGQIDGLIKRRS